MPAAKEDRWRTLYILLQAQKLMLSPYNSIQQLDGGFFERFGSLFREQAEFAANEELRDQQNVARAAEELENVSETAIPSSSENDLSESDIGSLDSEADEQKDKNDIIAAALNIDELYTEILYEILHNVGCDSHFEVGQIALLSYAQEAFKIQNDKHETLLATAQRKEPPDILINVEVIEAKELRPKDSNGLSDPFVTLFLESNQALRYNTSVKQTTLSPVWEEHFALPVAENTADDSLCIEVWDFDPAESVKEKLGKFSEVKGVKGMRKLLKELAITATTGQHYNELIGKAKIPLNAIPAGGMTMWYSLDKKNKVHRQGVIKIRLSFSSQKNNQVAGQEHRHMLRIILLHELETSKVVEYWWRGTFTPQANALLTQHIAQSGLMPTEVALCQWSVYCAVHQNHPLHFTLFPGLLEKLVKPLQRGDLCEEDTKIFWEGVKKLLPSCFRVIRKIRKSTVNQRTIMDQVTEVLKIFSFVCMLEPLPNTELFPQVMYPWKTYHGDDSKCDVVGTLEEAVAKGAENWLNHILENNKSSDNEHLSRLQNLIQIIQLLRTDLQKAIEFYDKSFQSIVNFQYAKHLYIYYQEKLSAICEPEVTNICKNFKRVSFRGSKKASNNVESDVSAGTTLFDLYLAIQRFVTLGNGLCPTEYDNFVIKNFHQWFYNGVAQWLDIAVYNALQRIEKAVELDNLVNENKMVPFSSSAVDTLTIFRQVKVFWQQLNWPDVETSYTFIAKIIDDICRCCVFYADQMSEKVEGMGEVQDVYEKKFEVTNEWCLAINNIDHVRECLQPFTEDLGMQELVAKLAELRSPLEAERCQHTLDTVVANAIDTVRNKIIELLETVVGKMAPAMKRLLIEGAELCNQDSNSVHRLMMYVDNNLSTLYKELNEDNFNRILSIVWYNVNSILQELIQSNLEKRRPPSFFQNLNQTLTLMMGSFKNPQNDCTDCDSLQQTEQILKINGLETSDLIHHVHQEMHRDFSKLQDSPFGEIAVRAKFEGDVLTVEIINGRNLIAMDSNGTSDSFVRVHCLPEHKFNGVEKPKTKTHNKTQFPLYDEKFTINFTREQKLIQDGLLLFSVKDKDLLGYNNQYIGEAFLHFRDIPETSDPIYSLPQKRLQLGRPKATSDGIRAIEYRQGDKQAKEFLRKYKQRMGG